MNTIFKRATLAAALLAPLAAWSQISVGITVAPPPLPIYAQPVIPGDGYLWTPGYWSWDGAAGDYDWVPGTWVLPPSPGVLWTPGYWAFGLGGVYQWHGGYWGPHVGYYGGLNYGYGYGGHGYDGGRWTHGHFSYNQAFNNVPQGRAHDVYNHPMPNRGGSSHDSFNGGTSAFHGQPTPGERRFEGSPHGAPTAEQAEHEHRAMSMPEQHMGNNHGQPPTAATTRPSGFGQPGVEQTRQPQDGQHMGAQPGGRPERSGRPEGGGQAGGETRGDFGGGHPGHGGGNDRR